MCDVGSSLKVYENGTQRAAVAYAATDRVGVRVRLDGIVEYIRGGIAVYASTVRPVQPLHFAVVWYDQNAVISRTKRSVQQCGCRVTNSF